MRFAADYVVQMKQLSFKGLVSFVFFAVAATNGCFPNHPTLTKRPTIDTKPWKEKTIKNQFSGNSYSYLHLEGPAEDAPVAILLHGGIFDNRIWYYCHDLSNKYNVYAPQYPDNNLYYTGQISDWGKVVKDFVDAVDVSPDLMVGVSNGAYGAIEYLTQNKTNVSGLVLVSTVMLSSSDAEIKKRTRMAKFALRLAPGKLQGLVESRATNKEYGNAPGKVSQADIFFVRPYPYYYQLFRVPVNQGSQKQATDKIKIPVLVLHGEEDDIMPLWAAEKTVEVFPNAHLQTFPGQGHDMTFSIGPRIAAAILEYFNE